MIEGLKSSQAAVLEIPGPRESDASHSRGPHTDEFGLI